MLSKIVSLTGFSPLILRVAVYSLAVIGIFGAGHYKGSESANKKHEEKQAQIIAQAAKEFNDRELENEQHRRKARTDNDAQSKAIVSRVRSDTDRLRDLIAGANQTTDQTCTVASGASEQNRSGDSVDTQRTRIDLANAQAIARLTAEGLVCAASLKTFAQAIEVIEK
jgi:hypothetical protein